jgi:exosortase
MTLSKRLDWRHVAGAVVLVAIGVWVRWYDWKDIYNIFVRDPEASHVILVAPVAAYLVWVRRERLRRIRFETSWLGPVVVAAGCAVCYFGEGHGYQSLRHFGAVTIAVGCLLTMLGRDVLLNFAPAFIVLAFLIPMPPTFRQRISLPLMSVTAVVTQDVSNVLGFAVERSGNQLEVNGQQVTIVEACNGLRMFFTLVLVSYVVAFSMPLRGYVRVLMVAASPVSSIVCNVVRLVPTVWVMGHMSHEQGAQFHDIAGWVMLPVAFAALYAIVWVLRWAMVPVGTFTLARD